MGSAAAEPFPRGTRRGKPADEQHPFGYGKESFDLAAIDVVTAVPTLLTMRLGPGEILVAAKVDVEDRVSGAQIEAASDEAERRLRARYPGIRYVFLDPTRGTAGRNHLDGGTDR